MHAINKLMHQSTTRSKSVRGAQVNGRICLTILGVVCHGAPQAMAQSTRLVAVTDVALAPGFIPVGGVVRADSAVLVWSTGNTTLEAHVDGSVKDGPTVPRGTVYLCRSGDDLIWIGERSVGRLQEQGAVERRLRIGERLRQLDGIIQSAACGASRAVVALLNASGESTVCSISLRDDVLESCSRFAESDVGATQALHVAFDCFRQRFSVATLRFPYSVVDLEIRPDSIWLATEQLRHSDLAGDAYSAVVALRPLLAEGAIVQILADQRSSLRWIYVHDGAGRTSSREVRIPMGSLAVDGRSGLLWLVSGGSRARVLAVRLQEQPPSQPSQER